MVILTDTEKVIDKISTLMIKKSPRSVHSGNPHQHNESHV